MWRRGDGPRLDGFHRRLRRTSPGFDRASPVRAGAGVRARRARERTAPAPARGARFGIRELRTKSSRSRLPRAARAREHGRIRSRIVRTEICNSRARNADRHRHRDCGLGTIGSSVIVVAILSRAGVHRTRHAESHNRAKRARLTGHRVPPGAGSDRSQPTRRHRPYDTPTLDRSSGSSPIISFRRASHIYYDQ